MIEDTDTVYCSGCHQDRPRAGHWFVRQPSGATDAFCRECWPQFCARQCSVATERPQDASCARGAKASEPVAEASEIPRRPKPIWERLPTRCGFDYEEYPYRVRSALVKHLCALLASQTYSVDAAVD